MYYYFHVQFKDPNADIYIVRVKSSVVDSYSRSNAEKTAKRIVTKGLTGVKEDDFHINNIALASLISQLVFVENIAQLSIVTNP